MSGIGKSRQSGVSCGAQKRSNPYGVPANDGIRLDGAQTIAPVGKPAADQNPEAPIGIAESRSGLTVLENDELLPKTVFDL